jgi:hypothetical protein
MGHGNSVLTCSLVWQSSFWLHIRPCTTRQHLAPCHSLVDVTSTLALRSRCCAKSSSRPHITFLLYPHIPTVRVGPGLLFASPCFDFADRNCDAHGHFRRLCLDELCDTVVYLQLKRHVLCGGQNERHARPCSIPFGTFLCWIRHHGDF